MLSGSSSTRLVGAVGVDLLSVVVKNKKKKDFMKERPTPCDFDKTKSIEEGSVVITKTMYSFPPRPSNIVSCMKYACTFA